MTSPAPYHGPSRWRPGQLVSEAADAMIAYQPDGMMEFIADLHRLPALVGNVKLIVDRMAAKTEREFPIDPKVVTLLRDLAHAFGTAETCAGVVGPGAKRAHEADRARHEQPRNGVQAEKGWNV